MANWEFSITINRPAADVFKALTNFDSYTEWMSGVIESTILTPAPTGVGSKYRFVSTFLGQKIESEGEITEYDPPNRYAWKSTKGPFPMEETTIFESAGSSTNVKISTKAEFSGFFKLAEGMVVSQGMKQSEADYGKLKALIESGKL